MGVHAGKQGKAKNGAALQKYSLSKAFGDQFEAIRAYELPSYIVFIKGTALVEWDVIEGALNGADLIYFDNDYMTKGKRHTPHFKPAWSFDTFMSVNYIEDCFAVRKAFLEGDQKEELQKAESVYELIYRIAKGGGKISHVDQIACHIETELLEDQEVYEEYVSEHRGLSVERLQKEIRAEEGYLKGEEKYSVSIVIPSKNNSEILERCLKSIVVKSSFNKLSIEVIIVDNGSIEEERNKITDIINNICYTYKEQAQQRGSAFDIRYIYEPADFNFSAMCDRGVKEARYDYLLFLNNDIELKDKGAIEKLCAYASEEDIGAVGLKLYYPDSTLIQHDGITDLDCGPSHKLAGHDDREVWYFGVNRFNRNVLAVTGACLMIRKEKYFNIGGFNVKMEISYNDVELCLKCLKKGWRNVVLNDTVMYHHESFMRGHDDKNDAKYQRLTAERELLYRSNEWLKKDGDPYYSRRLVSDTLDYFVNVMPDHERRSVRSAVREIKPKEINIYNKKKRKPDKHLKWNIERTSLERGLGDRRTDYYYIEGWFIDDKRDNAQFERSLVLLEEEPVSADLKEASRRGGPVSKAACGLEAELLPKYRKDVREVHKKAKRAELAGFVCKLPTAYIDKSKHYEVLLVMKKKGHKYGRVAVWDGAIL